MNCWNLRKIGASRFHLELASLEIDLNIYMLVQGPRYAEPSPHLHHWQLVK